MTKPCHEPEDYIYHEFVEPVEDVDIAEDDITREAIASLGHFAAHYGEL